MVCWEMISSLLDKLTEQIENTSAFIMVDDLDHLVKGGRLSKQHSHLKSS